MQCPSPAGISILAGSASSKESEIPGDSVADPLGPKFRLAAVLKDWIWAPLSTLLSHLRVITNTRAGITFKVKGNVQGLLFTKFVIQKGHSNPSWSSRESI